MNTQAIKAPHLLSSALLLAILSLAGCATPSSLVQSNNLYALQNYLERGGNPNTFTHGTIDKFTDAFTGLHYAAYKNHVEMVQALLTAGADVNATSQQLHITPLYIAARDGHTETVSVLLKAGAKPNIAKADNITPLYAASERGHLDAVKQLINAGANPNTQTIRIGASPLYAACWFNGHLDIVQQLLDAGANPNAQRKSGHAPAHCAAEKNQVDIIQTLAQHQADMNITTPKGTTPLHLAAQFGQVAATQALLVAGANIDKTNNIGETALAIAIEKKKNAVIDLLLNAGANPNTRADNGWTPLLVASWNGDEQTMTKLVQRGADIHVRTSQGTTVEKMFNRRELDRQAQQQQQQQSAKQQGGFQWGKFAALTAGAAAGGLTRVDSGTQLQVMSAITQDSLSSGTSTPNLQALASASGSATSGSVAAAKPTGTPGNYPARPNILAGHAACAGYTVDNYKTHFEANRNSADVQLHTHCASAYNYYWMYLNAIKQGYSQADSNITYGVYEDAANGAINFYQNWR